MSASSSDSEEARLSEAVRGVDVMVGATMGQSSASTKKQPRSHCQHSADSKSHQLVTRETQEFIAHKLSELLDRDYDMTAIVTRPLIHNETEVEGVRLLQSSEAAISLTPPSPPPPQKRHKGCLDSDSEEEEEEESRLQEAVVDTSVLLKGAKRS